MNTSRAVTAAAALALTAVLPHAAACADDVPKGTVSFFTRASACPSNWSEAQYTYGRLVLGSSTGGAPKPVGEPMGNASAPKHTHVINAVANIDYKNTATVGGTDKGVGKKGTYPANLVDNQPPRSVAAETSFPFIQFLACEFTTDPAAGDAFPIAAVSYFNRAQCPEGWITDPNYNGRFLLPMMPNGKIGFMTADAWSGTRTLAHEHALNSTVDVGSLGFVWGGGANSNIAEPELQPVTGQLERGVEPIMPYVALLACRKTQSATGTTLPLGMSMLYSGQNCPNGWQTVPGSSGRFLVGAAPSASPGAAFGGNPMSAGEITRAHAHEFVISFTLPNYDTDLTRTWENLWLGQHGTFRSAGMSAQMALTLPYLVMSHCERLPADKRAAR